MASVLLLRQVSAGWGTLCVLSGIDLEVEEGERVGLVGLNWRGKSTLLRSVVGLVDRRTGEIAGKRQPILRSATDRLVRRSYSLIDEPSLGLASGIGRNLLAALTTLDVQGCALILAEQNRALEG
jgi:ABC-type branched-subunit amino acid transport system ATPase component